MSGDPYPKDAQLRNASPRRFRHVANKAEWAGITREKTGHCRVCIGKGERNGGARKPYAIQFHHVVRRSHGGDDTPDNIVPLCPSCHAHVHARSGPHCYMLVTTLTDAEYSYAIDKMGEGYFERAYGIEYARK